MILWVRCGVDLWVGSMASLVFFFWCCGGGWMVYDFDLWGGLGD